MKGIYLSMSTTESSEKLLQNLKTSCASFDLNLKIIQEANNQYQSYISLWYMDHGFI